MHKYIEGEQISEAEIRKALRKGTLELKLVPVVTGSAFKNKGVQTLLDAVVDYLPSPLDVPPVEGVNPEDWTRLKLGRPKPARRFPGLFSRSWPTSISASCLLFVFTAAQSRPVHTPTTRSKRPENVSAG